MIIGNGLIASGFLNSKEDFNACVIFASGVSNSKETNVKQFERERNLILETISKNQDKKFIYFSSVLAGVSKNEYYIHNLEMEHLIKDKAKNFIIFKLPQVIGNSGNKNNLINHLVNQIKNDEELTVFINVSRALVDIDDVVKIVNYCKDKINRRSVEISHIEKINMVDLCINLGYILNKHINMNFKKNFDDNNWYIENHVIINDAIKVLNIEKEGYTNKALKKYIK
jgi:nucleoside-diphosphate-sugar epimerase